MRSYIILGIYSVLIAVFYQWEASLFLLMGSFFVELIILFIGTLIIGRNVPREEYDIGALSTAFTMCALIFIMYPIAYNMGDSYKEFSDPKVHGFWQPIYDYGWELAVIGLSLGVGYILDFNMLKRAQISDFISREVFRLSFLIFLVGLLGIMCVEGVAEFTTYYKIGYENQGPIPDPFTPASKMIPILAMVVARIAIELFFIYRRKRELTKKFNS